ncbi:MAG: hypothetical protein ACD_60C00153G0006 [uncultured bacterium]|nr:MAG: hypothetical protein ACD_60C00153G0006 [uncultured bacterium]
MFSVPNEDLAHIWDKAPRSLSRLHDSRIFITGGTGFFGLWLLQSIAYAVNYFGLKTEVTVLTRDHHTFLNKVPHLAKMPWLHFLLGDIKTISFPTGGFTHIIHAATDASAKLNEENPLEMFDTIVAGTRHILEWAVTTNVKHFLFVSSGAVYGKQPPSLLMVPESYLGSIDPLQTRSAYGLSKLLAEHLCLLFIKQHQLPIKIARCFAFVGPHLPLTTHFAIGNFIANVIKDEPIEVKGDGSPYRSYLYAADLVIWLWTILCEGTLGSVYNVGSEQAISIADLAKLISQKVIPSLPVVIANERKTRALPERYVPHTKRAEQELNLHQWIDLSHAISKTIEWNKHYAKSKSFYS